MIKRVFSAGGIVLKKVSKGPKEPKETKVLLTQHSGHKGWALPKGHIETGESSEQAALREVEEETGVVARVVEKVGQTQYFYHDAGEKIFKTVTLFLMEYADDGEATTAFEVSDKVWLPVDEVEGKLTFKDTKALWEKAKEKINKLNIDYGFNSG